MKLLGEKVTSTVLENEEIEWEVEDFALGEIEMDKGVIRNIREAAAVLLEITDQNTKFLYDVSPRPRFEVSAGYNIALKRGARLNEVKVYNMYFRFINNRIDGTAVATMIRPPKTGEEWILLLPDDTNRRIEIEKREFLNEARSLIHQGLISLDVHNHLLENLNLLSINERCAQTLMHEYGHILHWRMFDALSIYKESEVYQWFSESGYLRSVVKRIPDFLSLKDEVKLHFLKESLVEDYRISLNRKNNHDMFILPNRYTYRSDFELPDLLEEGISMMEKILQPAINGNAQVRKSGFKVESEIDTLKAIEDTRRRIARNPNWVPGSITMTEEDHMAVIERLRKKEKLEEEALYKLNRIK